VSSGKGVNLAASVHQKLINAARKTDANPNDIFVRYAMERLLYRLSTSKHKNAFVLKGAMLFLAWTGETYRPTFDLDLLGFGADSTARISDVFKELCVLKVEQDGLVFNPDNVEVRPIREANEYTGQRVTLVAFLGKARIPVQVDIGFGDAVTPKAELIDFPPILDFPQPRIRAYPRETVVAEKLHAMTILGIGNSRMKDFFDVYVLARDFEYDGTTLTKAIKATFKRRKTELPQETPLALTNEFGRDATKKVQWKAFLKKGGLDHKTPELLEVLSAMQEFLLPPLMAASGNETPPARWKSGGPWKK
jgi:predicted nucleotidyltransferase component of viral defense system